MELLREFKAIRKGDAGLAGGKGASLGEMTATGIPVPPGFVLLSAAFERFIGETGLNVEIDSILHTVDNREMHTVDGASEKIQALILAAAMPKDIEAEVKKYFKKLGAKFVAVRSSATAEDSASAAWAGQLDTFLNTTEDSLLENVKRCWASLFTPRAIFYRFEKNLHKTKISVAVVVQKMVISEISGIAFSVHPVTEDYNQLIIEGGYGLGEAIVSGQITPDSYVVEKIPRRIIDINVSTQERKLVRASSAPPRLSKEGTGGVVKGETKEANEWVNILAAEGERQKLSEKQILELSELILRIERHYGFPCDIEWAFEDNTFYITQSRPITTLKVAAPAAGAASTVSTEKLWINNFSAEECTYQLTSAMLEFGLQDSERALFGKKHRSLLSECFLNYENNKLEGGYLLDTDLSRFAEEVNKLIYSDPLKIQKLHKKAYALNDRYAAFARVCLKTKMEKVNNKKLADLHHKLTILQEKAHLEALSTTWFVDSHEAVFSNMLMVKTKEIVANARSKKNPAEVYSLLTTPAKNSWGLIEEIESLAIVVAILKDKKAKKIFNELRDYNNIPGEIPKKLARAMIVHKEKWCWMPFGYLGPAYGLDYYLSVWAGLVREGVNAKKLVALKKNRPREIAKQRARLFKELKVTSAMKKVYDIGADIAFLKGYRKDCSYVGFYAVDDLFKEIAKRLAIPLADLHILTYHEIEGLLTAKITYDPAERDRRKQRAIHYWDGEKITMLSGTEAEAFYAARSIKQESMDSSESTFKGTCASSGHAKGTVKIVNKPEEMYKMEQGDVMVSHTTFPSLVPAMKKASAIVTEDGGITCHAAIVSREMKTPCVTGIKVATKVFRDGDVVEVDADNGLVKIISKAPEALVGQKGGGVSETPVPFGGKDEWMLAENIPDMDMFFSQIFLSCFASDTSYPSIRNYSETLTVFTGIGMDFYFGKKDSFEVAESILEALVEKPEFGDEVNRNIVSYSKKLVDFSCKVYGQDLSKKSNTELWQLYEEHDTVHTKLYTYGWLPVALDMLHNNFTDKLKEYLRGVCASDKEVEEAFVVLCTPSKKTIIAEEREEFLNIFETHHAAISSAVAKKAIQVPPEIMSKLQKHAAEWGHLGYIYSGNADPFGPEHYFEEMREMVKNGITAKKVLDQEEKQLHDAEAKKRALYKKIKINDTYKRLFNTANDFALTKLVRRDAQLRTLLMLHRSLLSEIAKRLGISRHQVQFMLKGEIRDALEDGLIDRDLLRRRLETCVLYTKKDFERVYVGMEADTLRSGIKSNIDHTQTEFKGQTAQPGFATGTVKIIIRAKDMGKMNQGDILVSIATDPDIVPAMKKAAAIVTEQGGITSHAAIVSRELGTPCIIGTKIATKLLKDGDTVEVDANKGIVKILKRV